MYAYVYAFISCWYTSHHYCKYLLFSCFMYVPYCPYRLVTIFLVTLLEASLSKEQIYNIYLLLGLSVIIID